MAIRGSGTVFSAESMGAGATSDVISRSGGLVLSLHMTAPSDTHAGSLTIEVSNDGSNWITHNVKDNTDSSVASIPVAAGAALDAFATIDAPSKYARVIYTRTAGTGALTVIAESIGAPEDGDD